MMKMIWKNCKWLLPLTLLSGCAEIKPGDHYTIYLDPAFAPTEQSSIVEGLADWTTKVPVTFDVVIATCNGFSDGVICTHRATTSAELPGDNGDLLGATLTYRGLFGTRGDTGGWSLDPFPEGALDGGEIWIDMSQVEDAISGGYPSALTQTFNHEVGHAMGLVHHYDPIVALMNPDIQTASPTVTCDDVSQWYYVRFHNPPTCDIQ
jgi:hypothetical protein